MRLVPRRAAAEPDAEPDLRLPPWAGTGNAEPGPGAASSGNRPVPAWLPTVIDGEGNQNYGDPGSDLEPGASLVPVPGSAVDVRREPGTGKPSVPVLVLAGWRAAAAASFRMAQTPGHPLNHAWEFTPMSLAEHHAHAADAKHTRAQEIQLRTAGRFLVIAGNGLSGLGVSAKAQRIAAAVVILVLIAVFTLVL